MLNLIKVANRIDLAAGLCPESVPSLPDAAHRNLQLQLWASKPLPERLHSHPSATAAAQPILESRSAEQNACLRNGIKMQTES